MLLLILFVLTIGLGYAFLNTTLNINGISKIKDAKWDIHWENPQVMEGSISNDVPVIDSLRTTTSFSVVLNNPGDYYEFTVDAVNSGTIDGMISEIHSKYNGTDISETNKLPKYINYTVTYSDGRPIGLNHKLKATRSEVYRVKVEYNKDISIEDLPEDEVNLDLGFSVTYVQATDDAVIRDGVCGVTIYDNGPITESRYLDLCESYIDESLYTYEDNDDGTVTITGFVDGVQVQTVSSTHKKLVASKLGSIGNYKAEKMDNELRTITFKDNVWALPLELGGKKVTKISGIAFNDKSISADLVILQ